MKLLQFRDKRPRPQARSRAAPAHHPRSAGSASAISKLLAINYDIGNDGNGVYARATWCMHTHGPHFFLSTSRKTSREISRVFPRKKPRVPSRVKSRVSSFPGIKAMPLPHFHHLGLWWDLYISLGFSLEASSFSLIMLAFLVLLSIISWVGSS